MYKQNQQENAIIGEETAVEGHPILNAGQQSHMGGATTDRTDKFWPSGNIPYMMERIASGPPRDDTSNIPYIFCLMEVSSFL